MSGAPGAARRVMFMYLGRRGPVAHLIKQVSQAAVSAPNVKATIVVSRQNENIETYQALGTPIYTVDTYKARTGALLAAWRIPLIRRSMAQRLASDRTEAVIDLMPHVWSSFIAPAIRASGVRYVPIVHDADPHPGDPTALVKRWIDRALLSADSIITLSDSVANRLADSRRFEGVRVARLFHPDLDYAASATPSPLGAGEPLRLLFLGRIMPYKGLTLFLDAVDLLKSQGVLVEIGVFGEGALGTDADRLVRLGAEVENRWLTDEEIGTILPRFHAVVLSHLEASQSGVASTAFGAGLPVVATPVGGLVEQISHRETGILADSVDPNALASAIRELLHPELYRVLVRNIEQRRASRSVANFITACVETALRD